MRLIVLLFGIGSGVAVCGDVSYTTTSRSSCASPGDAGQTTKYYFKGQRIKIDRGGVATAIDVDAQTITNIDSNQKSYFVADLTIRPKQSRKMTCLCSSTSRRRAKPRAFTVTTPGKWS